MININYDQQRKFIIWLSGLYGLLLGLIVLISFDLRMGIDSGLQLMGLLAVVASVVLLCDFISTKILARWNKPVVLGKGFWMTFISLLPFLLLTVLVLNRM